MQKLTFDVAGHKYDVEVASCWNEVSQDEFITFVKYLGNQGEGIDISTLLVMAKIPEVAAINLTTAQWWWIHDHFKWMLDMEKVDSLMIDTLTLADGTVLHGYNGDFSDVTFEEWMFADTYANANRWDVVAAVLYRPEKENWDGESDRRIPFTKYGADKRSSLIAELDGDIIKAVRLNYLLLRRRLTLKYKRLFYDADEIENDESKQKKRSGANWLSLVRNVMGDNFYEEEKYLRISVPAMFFQLDRMIKESNERKRHGNK